MAFGFPLRYASRKSHSLRFLHLFSRPYPSFFSSSSECLPLNRAVKPYDIVRKGAMLPVLFSLILFFALQSTAASGPCYGPQFTTNSTTSHITYAEVSIIVPPVPSDANEIVGAFNLWSLISTDNGTNIVRPALQMFKNIT